MITDTQARFEIHALEVLARTESKPLTGVQEYAIDLYKRGFNVFPTPTAHEWNLRDEDKKPYILHPLFTNRLHYVKDCSCATCRKYNYISLFENSNLAMMCGATSGNLLSVDCDSQKAFDFVGNELKKRGLVFPYVWAFTSHKGGHYLMRVIEGVVKDIPQKKSKIDEVQVWGNRHFIIVPPSIHSKGTFYKWQTPEPLTMLPRDTLQAVSIESLDWLGVTLNKFPMSKNEEDIIGLPEYAKNLSHASRHTLKHGAEQGGRNSALCGLSCDLVAIGLNKGEVKVALLTAAGNCEPPYPSEKNDTPISKIIQWAFSKERKPSRKYQSKAMGKIQEWQKAQAFAHSYDWRGNFGGRSSFARQVYSACIERARLDSRDRVFRASVREMAEHTGMHKNTMSKYLRLFTAKGLLKWEGNETSGANSFSFLCGTSTNLGQYINIDSILSQNRTTKNNTFPHTPAEKNAFHRLGKYAFRVWRELCGHNARSLYEVAKRLKIRVQTAKDTIGRLVSVGLVEFSKAESLYIGNLLTDAQLEIIAINRGTQSKAQERRQRDTLDREKHVNRLVSEAKSYYKRQSAKMLRSL